MPLTSIEICNERQLPAIINIHDVELAKRFTSRVIGISKGGIVYDGPPAELTNEHLKVIYGGEDWLK